MQMVTALPCLEEEATFPDPVGAWQRLDEIGKCLPLVRHPEQMVQKIYV